jgi:uncharacterized membrane protein YfcA
MNAVYVLLLFGAVVMLTHFLDGITGFGATVLALPFCTMLVGIRTAVPALTVFSWILSMFIVIIDRRHIVWHEFFKITGLVILGLPAGMLLFSRLPERGLKIILGIFMVIIAARGIYLSFRKTAKAIRVPGFLLNILLVIGGVVHGAFASGGPFVVIYATKNLPDKSNFRATLCMLWVTLNTVMIIQKFMAGAMTPAVGQAVLVTLPFLAAGMILGNLAHGRLRADMFTKLIYIVLFVSGIFMFI